MIRRLTIGILTLASLLSTVAWIVSLTRAVHFNGCDDTRKWRYIMLDKGSAFVSWSADGCPPSLDPAWTSTSLLVTRTEAVRMSYAHVVESIESFVEATRKAALEHQRSLAILEGRPRPSELSDADLSGHQGERRGRLVEAQRNWAIRLADAVDRPVFVALCPPPLRGGIVRFPLWMATAALSLYPAIAFIRGPLRRWRRRRRGACLSCGYALVGNVPGVCPECGKQIARSAT